MQEEAVLASRDFVNEGEFLPEITSARRGRRRSSPPSPPLLGYVATTRKPAGGDAAAHRSRPRPAAGVAGRSGLGRATAWTSDASARWSQLWVGWDGYVDFWTGVVRDTFASTSGTTAVSARVEDGVLRVTVEQEGAFADGAAATARVAGPDLQPVEVPLERSGAGRVRRRGAGRRRRHLRGRRQRRRPRRVDVVGAARPSPRCPTPPSSSRASPTRRALDALAEATGGRGAIEPGEAFDAAGLAAGRTRTDLAPWFVLAACLLWPVAVALSRLRMRGTAVAASAQHGYAWVRWVGARARAAVPARPGTDRAERPPAAPPKPIREKPAAPVPEPARTPTTVGTLLARKQETRAGKDESARDQ